MALWGGFVVEAADTPVHFAGDTGYGTGNIFRTIGARFGAIDHADTPANFSRSVPAKASIAKLSAISMMAWSRNSRCLRDLLAENRYMACAITAIRNIWCRGR